MLEEVVRDKAFFNDLTDRKTRIQTGVGILEDDLQILAQSPHFTGAQAGKVNAVIQHGFILCKLGIILVLCFDSIQFALQFADFLSVNSHLVINLGKRSALFVAFAR